MLSNNQGIPSLNVWYAFLNSEISGILKCSCWYKQSDVIPESGDH